MKEREKLDDTLFQIARAVKETRVPKHKIWEEMRREKVGVACTADDAYMRMALTDVQRETIDRMLELRSEAEACEQTIAYLTGISDGFLFLRSLGFLDMYVMDEDNEGDEEEADCRQEPERGLEEPDERVEASAEENTKRGCYLLAVFPDVEGCMAVKMNLGEVLAGFVKEWQCRGAELVVISRPEAYGEYNPYRFMVSLESFRRELEYRLKK